MQETQKQMKTSTLSSDIVSRKSIEHFYRPEEIDIFSEPTSMTAGLSGMESAPEAFILASCDYRRCGADPWRRNISRR